MKIKNFELLDVSHEVESAFAKLLGFLEFKRLYTGDPNQVTLARNRQDLLILTMNLNLDPSSSTNQIRIAVCERSKRFSSEGLLSVAFYARNEEMVLFEFMHDESDSRSRDIPYRWCYSYDVSSVAVREYIARYLGMKDDQTIPDFDLMEMVNDDLNPISPFVHGRIKHVVDQFAP